MRPALLLLMHQGRSFTQEVADAAQAGGVALVALSSRPEHDGDLDPARHLLDDVEVSEADRLAPADIDGVVQRFAERGFAIEAAVATYEGYRLLMATLNGALGAPDASVVGLRLCLDKYELRCFLRERGLSAVRTHLLADDQVPDLDPARRWFVKPVRGASSFAAFRLDDVGDLAELPAIQRQMRADHRMAAIFMDRFDFLVEEYVEGPEFSFEMVLLDEPHHVCVHEKARVERLARTTLEVMSVSPPVTLPTEVLLRGVDFVTSCFRELKSVGITAGAYHVEAKYWIEHDRWEIIEINPRPGGSLIDASARVVTGESILNLWVTSLLASGPERQQLRERVQRASQIDRLRAGTATRGSLFLSKYGEKGRTVDEISFDSDDRPPHVLRLHARAGTVIADSDRAICLMDALWEVAAQDLASEIDRLDDHSTRRFRVRYR